MNSFAKVSFGLVFITTCYQVESLMWNLKTGGLGNFKLGYNTGNIGWRDSYGDWENGRSNPWNSNSGLFGNTWNFPTGNTKGSNMRRCFDSRQCSLGECCQIIRYNTGACVYGGYGCNDRLQNFGWFQRPIQPGNNKGDQVTVAVGRPGACPPPQFVQGPLQYCRIDENCPNSQKCCYFQGKAVCLNAIFA
ncbi:WAP domain-containing protein [Caerostris darwini]|uniref:WAP domain-containing protein n=1 Tax=Caerostris darwini TaxID=1538125 RepID=A0AAV4T0K8_9ARAC|nr:WAP domain-containing protein [Caerostris darwini]